MDPLFPIPEPTFLWVYPLILRSEASAIVDSEGRWTQTTGASALVHGYLAAPDDQTLARAGVQAQLVDAVALVPLGTTVKIGDELLVSGVSDYLNGVYRVNNVRPNPSHVRVLTSRISGDAVPVHLT